MVVAAYCFCSRKILYRRTTVPRAYCLGCCWALICVLFVVGVMNLMWVAALTGFVLIEKIGPAGAIVARVAGGAMVVFGIVSIV